MPFGQFYGGPEQDSLAGLAGLASDKNQVTWFLIHAFVPRQVPPAGWSVPP